MDCANCANKMEDAAKRTAGVKDASVNFMMLKMNVEFEDGQNPKDVMKEVLKTVKKLRTTVKFIFNRIRQRADFEYPPAYKRTEKHP